MRDSIAIGGVGLGMVAFAIAANVVFWYAIVFYVVIPGIAKLREMGII